MFIKIMIDEIICGTPTENNLFNDMDEVYFAVAGASSQGPIRIERISPRPPKDYYGLHAREKAQNIQLWEGWIAHGESVFLTVLVREQDNAQLEAIANGVKSVALGLASVFVPSLAPTALGALKDTALSLVNSFEKDGDDTIGVFSVMITNQGQEITAVWDTIMTTRIVSPAPHTGFSKLFSATGDEASYTVKASIKKSQLPMIVNRNSGKCLDVAGGSVNDQALVQQYSKHGGNNQRWLLKPLGFSVGSPVSFMPCFQYAIIANHSGKCLDVAGNSTSDQAAVQQYSLHYGENQSWALAPIWPTQDFALVNLHSRKVLEVVGSSTIDGARVQQSTYNGSSNQRWRLEY